MALVNKKNLEGIVVSDAMSKTIVVAVKRQFSHPKYSKQIRRTARYKVHDGKNTARVGDRVLIEECRPISKQKNWLLKQVIEKAV